MRTVVELHITGVIMDYTPVALSTPTMLLLYSALCVTIANAYSIDWAGPYSNYWGEYWAVKQYGFPPNIDPTQSGEPVYTYV